jgi:hypothetical protein
MFQVVQGSSGSIVIGCPLKADGTTLVDNDAVPQGGFAPTDLLALVLPNGTLQSPDDTSPGSVSVDMYGYVTWTYTANDTATLGNVSVKCIYSSYLFLPQVMQVQVAAGTAGGLPLLNSAGLSDAAALLKLPAPSQTACVGFSGSNPAVWTISAGAITAMPVGSLIYITGSDGGGVGQYCAVTANDGTAITVSTGAIGGTNGVTFNVWTPAVLFAGTGGLLATALQIAAVQNAVPGLATASQVGAVPAGVAAMLIAAGLAQYQEGDSGPLQWTPAALALAPAGGGLTQQQLRDSLCLDHSVDTTAAAGSIDAQLAMIAATVSTSPIQIRNLIDAGGAMTIAEGTDYPAGRAICFGIPSAFMSLAGSTPSLEFTPLVGGVPSLQPFLKVTGSLQTGSITINGQVYTCWLQFTPTATQTGELTNLSPQAYVYRVRCYWYNDATPPVATETIEVVSQSPCTATW